MYICSNKILWDHHGVLYVVANNYTFMLLSVNGVDKQTYLEYQTNVLNLCHQGVFGVNYLLSKEFGEGTTERSGNFNIEKWYS